MRSLIAEKPEHGDRYCGRDSDTNENRSRDAAQEPTDSRTEYPTACTNHYPCGKSGGEISDIDQQPHIARGEKQRP